MKKCDVMVQVDVLRNDCRFINDNVEFSYESQNDYDCMDSIEIMLENLLDNNEIEVDKRYIIIADIKQDESYDWEYGPQYDEYVEAKEIFEIDTNIIDKYYAGECEDSLKENELQLINPNLGVIK